MNVAAAVVVERIELPLDLPAPSSAAEGLERRAGGRWRSLPPPEA